MQTATTISHLPRRLVSGLARRLLLDRPAEFWLGEIDATWSSRDLRARVVSVTSETPDVKTFALRPNRAWRGHLAGQHTTIEVEIDGVRVRRCYSISSAPGDPLPAITVKRVAGGRVSGWLHDRVRPGHVLGLTPAAGEFVLPAAPAPKLLMLSGGSGITPIMSMLRELASRGAIADVVLWHHARSEGDVIFRRAIQDLVERHAGLRFVRGLSDGTQGPGRFEEGRLRTIVPDFAERETLLCGPPALMERVGRLWAEMGVSHRLRSERFAPPAVRAPASGEAPVTVTLGRSGRSFTAGSGTLLEELERAGERPAHGCRMGICRTCRCRKLSGRVENLLTGAVSGEPDEEIQPCISVARSDMAVDL